ncbi:MAG: hypothetical protein M3323_09815 [Actinomycetota bacterium]|nr:hypothetical protein [Actinomycetota bacterium]
MPVEWGTPPPDAPRHEGIFSLWVDDALSRTRRLPSLYHGNAQIFAHRDAGEVRTRLVRTIRAVLERDLRPSYLVAACKAGDRYGLYARDIFNRDPFRMRALRAGLELADEPYVQMTEDGAFRCEGWDPFLPEFVVVKSLRGPEGQENVNRGAFLTFLFGILRVGDMGAVELRHLVRTIKTAEVVAEDDPARLVEVLKAGQPVS